MFFASFNICERLSKFIAADVAVFESEEDRNEWVAEDLERIPLTEKEAFSLVGSDYMTVEEDGIIWAEKKGTLHNNGIILIPA